MATIGGTEFSMDRLNENSYSLHLDITEYMAPGNYPINIKACDTRDNCKTLENTRTFVVCENINIDCVTVPDGTDCSSQCQLAGWGGCHDSFCCNGPEGAYNRYAYCSGGTIVGWANPCYSPATTCSEECETFGETCDHIDCCCWKCE